MANGGLRNNNEWRRINFPFIYFVLHQQFELFRDIFVFVCVIIDVVDVVVVVVVPIVGWPSTIIISHRKKVKTQYRIPSSEPFVDWLECLYRCCCYSTVSSSTSTLSHQIISALFSLRVIAGLSACYESIKQMSACRLLLAIENSN